MAWIELHQSIWTHRKTLLLASELDLEEIHAAAYMIKLWTWALDNAQDGDLSELPPKVIAFGAGWQKEPETFVRAAIKSKWFDETESGLYIHDWEEYAGKLMERREAEKERSRKRRADAKKQQDNQKTTAGRPPDDQQTTVGTVPNRTVPNRTVPKPPISPQGEQKEKAASFDVFWLAYPKKRSKGDAEKAWKKIKPDKQLQAAILSKLEQAKASVEWAKDGGQYIPHPATWLNAKGWEDEYTPVGLNHGRADPGKVYPLPRAFESIRQFAEEGDSS